MGHSTALAILGTLGVFMTYMGISRVFGRRSGLLAAGVLMTSPLYFSLSRQALPTALRRHYDHWSDVFILAYFGLSIQLLIGVLLAGLLEVLGFSCSWRYPSLLLLGGPSPDRDLGVTALGCAFWLTIQKTGWIHTVLYFWLH